MFPPPARAAFASANGGFAGTGGVKYDEIFVSGLVFFLRTGDEGPALRFLMVKKG
jgi:hypothetical protein